MTIMITRRSLKKSFAVSVAAVFFSQSILLGSLPLNQKESPQRTHIWGERKKSSQQVRSASFASVALPSISQPLHVPGLGLGLGVKSEHVNLSPSQLPSWIPLAVAPFATIQDIRSPSSSAPSKTIFLIQDAHFHSEAQKNIADTITSLHKNLSEKNIPLLIGMEGAPSGLIDYSAYHAYPYPINLKQTAEGMMRAHILNGPELAAIDSGSTAPGLALSVTGVEDRSMYDQHVEALRDGYKAKQKTIKHLARLDQILQDLKDRYFDETLKSFDDHRSGYEEGKISVPQYVLYLDSKVTAESPRLRELIEAALLEKIIHFPNVETQRVKMVRALVEKMDQKDSEQLIQLAALFRSGQISHGSFYEYLKTLAQQNGVSLSDYPEMNIYIQYVLKTEAIDHGQLFSDIAVLEKNVEQSLKSTSLQKEVLSLSRDVALIRKLLQHALTEREWVLYRDNKISLERLKGQLAKWGLPTPSQLKSLFETVPVFEKFYELASLRNESMAQNFISSVESFPSRFSVLVTGGFHCEGLTQILIEHGFHVVVISPKITTPSPGPSSLDVLATSRLPLDRLFVGEKLFLPTPPVTAAQPGLVRDLALAASDAGVKIKEGQSSATVRFGTVEVHVSRDESPAASFEVEDERGRYHVTAQPVGKHMVSAIFGQPFSWIEALEDVVTREFKAGSEDRYQGYLLHVLGRVLDLGEDNTSFNPAKRTDFDSSNRKTRNRWFNEIQQRYPVIVDTLDELKRSVIRKDRENVIRHALVVARYLADVYPHAMDRAVRWALRVGTPPFRWSSVFQEVEARLEKLKKEMGLHDKLIYLSMVKGRGLFKLAEIKAESFIGEDVVRYKLEMSVSFLEEYVLLNDYIQAAMEAGNLTEPQARAWLIDRFLAHELAEAFLRIRSSDTSKDRFHQRAVHDILMDNGFGMTPPPRVEASQNETNPYANTAARRLAAVISKNPGLFQDGFRLWARRALNPNGAQEKGPLPPASFYGNNPFEIIVYALLDRLVKEPAKSAARETRKKLNVGKDKKKSYAVSYFITALKKEIYRLLNSGAPYPLEIFTGSNAVFKNLRALVRPANDMPLDELARRVAAASLPLFNSVHLFADRIVKEAGLRRSEKLVYEDYVLQHIDSYFDTFLKDHFKLTQAEVVLEVLEADAALDDKKIAFIQRFPGAGQSGNTLFKIRVTRQTLRRVLSLSDYIYRQAFQRGVFLTNSETQKMAVDIFFAHELAEGVLDISDEELAKMGVANRERLSTGLVRLEHVFVTPEGLAGRLKASPLGPQSAGQVKDIIADPVSSSTIDPILLRQRELEVLNLLERARPILDSVFPQRSLSAAQVRFSADRKAPAYNEGDKRVNLESFRKIRGSLIEKSRLTTLVTPSSEEKMFRPTADIFRTVRVGEADTLTIFDQNGGLKDLTDLYAKYKDDEKRKAKGSFIVGVLQTQEEFGAQLQSYIDFLKKGEAHEREVNRAQTLLDDFSNGVSSLKVLTLDESAPPLKQNESNGTWDVTVFVDYFRAKALAIQPNLQLQRVVFVSDWRQLVAQQIDIAVWMVMNLNMFIDINERIQVESVAAIQA